MAEKQKKATTSRLKAIKRFLKMNSSSIVLFLILIILTGITVETIFSDKFYPNIYIADAKLSFSTKNQAYRLVSSKVEPRIKQPLNIKYQDKTYNIDLSGTQIDYISSINEAFSIGHDGQFDKKLKERLQLLKYPIIFTPRIIFNIDKQISKIAKEVNEPAQDASIWLDEKNQIQLTPGQQGIELDKENLELSLKYYIAFGTPLKELPVKNTDPKFNQAKALLMKKALGAVQTEALKLTNEKDSWTIDVPTLYYLLNTEGDSNSILNNERLTAYINDKALKINQPVQEPLFKFEKNRNRVTEFKPSQDGRELDTKQTLLLIETTVNNLPQADRIIPLPINIVKPKLQNLEADNLGIKDLLGSGVSNFAGSIENRIYNVGLTASKIDGVLIPPGETFSFDKTVGDISAATGFKQAYVIKSGRTVLDDGGGVCQDSTTLFRAVLNAGLPIIERTAHAYRVGYYEQGFPPGLDATIFYPTVDFKFKNDTSAYILIQAHTEGTTLYVDLYGTSDGRVAEISKPIITSQTPPPPELRQDDPTLPRGQVKQVDWAAWGAKVSFDRTVTRNGEVISKETWRSNYKPWQAVYLVGTKD